MKRRPTGDMACSVARASDVIGDPWTLIILRDAILGVGRFDDWVRRNGIPRATLSARLQHLVEHGVMVKQGDRYELTPKGRGLNSVIITLMQWGDRWERDDPPPSHFVDADTGHVVEPVLVDRATGTPLAELHLRTVGPITDGITRV